MKDEREGVGEGNREVSVWGGCTLIAIGGIALVTGRGERVIALGAIAVGFLLLAVVVVAHLFCCKNVKGWGMMRWGKNGVCYDRMC